MKADLKIKVLNRYLHSRTVPMYQYRAERYTPKTTVSARVAEVSGSLFYLLYSSV